MRVVLSVSCGLLAAHAYIVPRGVVNRLRPLLATDANGGQEITIDVDENEVRLGELIFSSRDPRLDVAASPEYYGEDFCEYVITKADESDDLEERVALKSLVDMVRDVRTFIENATAEEDEAKTVKSSVIDVEALSTDRGPILDSTADILAAARMTQATELGDNADFLDEDVFMEAGLSGDALATYDALLSKLVDARSQGALEAEVELLFDRCDYSLLQLATSRRDDATYLGNKEDLAEVIDAVNAMAARRLESAVARLGSVLRAGNPTKIMEKMTEIAAKDEIDVQLLELIEVNKQQAQAAGPAGANAVELMTRLANKCKDSLDRKFADEPEKRLLRALLRAENPEQREMLLKRAFEPKEELVLSMEGEEEKKTKGGPEVEPPVFIKACEQLIKDFGNIDDDGSPLSKRVFAIADQAERVAMELFGEIQTPQEQQDRMWADGTTSVFDLEAAELQADTKGEQMPWHTDQFDSMLPPGFDEETGIKRM